MTKTKNILIIVGCALLAILVVLILLFAPRVDTSDMTLEANNFLLKADFKVVEVTNATKRVIGERGYIKVAQDKLKNITPEELKGFADVRVEGSGLNWVSIMPIYGDEGICFAGSQIGVPCYGIIDKEGILTETLHDWILQDGVYVRRD